MNRWEVLTDRMDVLLVKAREFWKTGELEKSYRIGDTIKKIAEVRLKYISLCSISDNIVRV